MSKLCYCALQWHVKSQTVYSNFPQPLTKYGKVNAVDFSLHSGYFSFASSYGNACLFRWVKPRKKERIIALLIGEIVFSFILLDHHLIVVDFFQASFFQGVLMSWDLRCRYTGYLANPSVWFCGSLILFASREMKVPMACIVAPVSPLIFVP